jgi:hypothetical protein
MRVTSSARQLSLILNVYAMPKEYLMRKLQNIVSQTSAATIKHSISNDYYSFVEH